MTRVQRYRYEMLVRVREYGTAHQELFPEASVGGQKFRLVGEVLKTVDEHTTNYVLARTDARRIKAATRAAVLSYMRILAGAARRVTRSDRGESPFRMPPRRSTNAVLTTARAFLEKAEPRSTEFVQHGFPATFISDFRALVDQLQGAVSARQHAKTARSHARVSVATALNHGVGVASELDVVVALGAQADPAALEAWQTARRVEGGRRPGPSTEPQALTDERPALAADPELAKAS